MSRTAGPRIRAARERRGWRVERLAAAAEVSERTIRNVETGRVSPKLTTVAKIAAALGLTVGGLCRG